MTETTSEFADWLLEWNPVEPHKLWNVYGDLATLAARQHEVAVTSKSLIGHMRAMTSDNSGWMSQMNKALDAIEGSLRTAEEFQERYG